MKEINDQYSEYAPPIERLKGKKHRRGKVSALPLCVCALFISSFFMMTFPADSEIESLAEAAVAGQGTAGEENPGAQIPETQPQDQPGPETSIVPTGSREEETEETATASVETETESESEEQTETMIQDSAEETEEPVETKGSGSKDRETVRETRIETVPAVVETIQESAPESVPQTESETLSETESQTVIESFSEQQSESIWESESISESGSFLEGETSIEEDPPEESLIETDLESETDWEAESDWDTDAGSGSTGSSADGYGSVPTAAASLETAGTADSGGESLGSSSPFAMDGSPAVVP